MPEITVQDKFGFRVTSGDHKGTYAPFDTPEAADKTAAALRLAGLRVSKVEVIRTVSTARSIAKALAPVEEDSEG